MKRKNQLVQDKVQEQIKTLTMKLEELRVEHQTNEASSDSIISCLQDNSGEEADNFVSLQDNFIKDLQEVNADFEKFQQMVETTLDLKQVEQGHFMIRPGWLLTVRSH